MKDVVVIGGGFAGLAAACFLAKEGCKVTVIEKNEDAGGRCRAFETDGFLFDMGPSWYWMPDVFERFYQKFGYTTSDFYELKRLDPSYQVVFEDGDILKVPANYEELRQVFESYEPGSAKKLDQFLEDGGYKYEVGMREFVHKPSLSISEFVDNMWGRYAPMTVASSSDLTSHLLLSPSSCSSPSSHLVTNIKAWPREEYSM